MSRFTLVLACFSFLLVSSVKAQFILGDDQNRTTFLNTPSSLTFDAADDKLSFNVNNLVDAKSNVDAPLWGLNYKGGSNNSESFLWQGGKFVFGSEVNGFLGFTWRMDKAAPYLRSLVNSAINEDELLKYDYLKIIKSFKKKMKWKQNKVSQFEAEFFGSAVVKPIEDRAFENFSNINAKEVQVVSFVNSNIDPSPYRTYLAEVSAMKMKHVKITAIHDKFLRPLYSEIKNLSDDSEIKKKVLAAWKWVETTYAGDAKLDQLRTYFSIAKNGANLDVTNLKSYKAMDLEKVPHLWMFSKPLYEEEIYDTFIGKGFSHSEVKAIVRFVYDMVAAKEANSLLATRASNLRTRIQLKIRDRERDKGVTRGTAFVRGGLFGSNFNRIDTLAGTLAADSLAFSEIKFRGEYFEIGVNITHRGKLYFGASYTWEQSDNFKSQKETEFSFVRNDTIGGNAFATQEKKSAFVGHYIEQGRRIFSFDASYIIDSDPLSDSSNLIAPHFYIRHNVNKSEFLENATTVGVGLNFYKKNTKFLFGLFIQKNDFFDLTEGEDEKWKDTLDFGLRAAYSIPNLSAFR